MPTLEEMIYAFDRLYKFYDKHHVDILRRLNYDPQGFDVVNLKLQEVDYIWDEEIKRKWFGDAIPIKVYYALLKHILISEDMRYKRPGNLGRDMIIMAIYDHIQNKVPMEKLKLKYNFTNF